MLTGSLLLVAVVAADFNFTKCPAPLELQRPGMAADFTLDAFEGFYYELAFHDYTQFPLCPDGHPRCITSSKAVLSYADGSKYVNDTWDLQCFGHSYPQHLLFNTTSTPGFLDGFVPVSAVPFLPKGIIAGAVFPDTVVDFKAGPDGWALEVQCVEKLGHVIFLGINFYSKVNSEAAFQEMLKAAEARGMHTWMYSGLGLHRVDHKNCPKEPQEPVVLV